MKRQPAGCAAGLGLIVLVGVFGAIITGNKEPSAPTPAPAPKITADCTIQAHRKVLIQKAIDQGYWQKIEKNGNVMHVNATPIFANSTTFDDKKSFISAVSAYDVCEGGDGTVAVIDAMNGERIGYFSAYCLDRDE